jgi:hypothetical protein
MAKSVVKPRREAKITKSVDLGALQDSLIRTKHEVGLAKKAVERAKHELDRSKEELSRLTRLMEESHTLLKDATSSVLE